MRILSIGECMAELAPLPDKGDYRLGFAGDTFNTAWYLARIAPQADVAFLTSVGDDTLSNDMRTFFRDSGISDQFVGTVQGKTVGLYLISLQDGERSFTYWRGQSAARELARDRDALNKAMDASDLIYFSGITLAILDHTSRENLLSALQRARAAGKTIAFDPNLRPRLWATTAEMTDAIMAGAAVCDISLPSFEDEAAWFGDASPEATANRYSDAGARQTIVKNGSGPVTILDESNLGTVDVTPVAKVTDTTAAGDSFNAGFLAAILQGEAVDQAVADAARIAGRVVQSRGALVAVNVG